MIDCHDSLKILRGRRQAYQVFGLSLSLGLIVGWYCLLIEPLRIERVQLADQQAAEKQLKQRERQILDRQAQATLKLEKLRARDDLRIERSAAKLDSAAFLSWVNERSEAVGLAIRDFRPSGRETQPDYQGFCVSLSGQGSFESICRFLDELRRCPRMNRVTSLELLPRDEERASFQLNLNVVLYTFRPQPVGANP